MYLAKHQKLNTYRAIKQIRKDSFEDMSQFLSEARLLKNLKHPGIPIIFDIEENKEFIFLIEEYVQGESLEAFVLRQKNISENQIAKIGVQLCDILSYLHSQRPYPILYQDMKPEHIIVCADQVKLVDFGISFYFGRKGNIYQSYGTKQFTSPEVLAGKETSIQADLYGTGSVLCYMLNHSEERCSNHFYSIIQKATSENIKERYKTAENLKMELLSFLDENSKQNLQTGEYLLKTIAIVGSEERIGVTHFSISMNSYLNWSGHTSIYMEKNRTGDLKKLKLAERTGKEKNGLFYYEYFRGKAYEGNGIRKDSPDFGLNVLDYGSESMDIQELEEADLQFLILGSRPWEKENAQRAYERSKYCRNLRLVCNFGSHAEARYYAKRWKRKVYCFPLDADPFCVTKEKIQFFTQLFEREGW